MNNFLERGVFILSLDTELAWGSAHNGRYNERQIIFQKTRSCIGELLTLLDKYRIHATWAIVGHLFLKSCRPVNGVKHPEIVRPQYPWYPRDWLTPDPCSDLEAAPYYYGADIVRQILDCKAQQEIGCHTFSHVIAGDASCSRECFASELRACRFEAEKLGVNLRSFVFPRNSVGHLDVLVQEGFTAFRGLAPAWFKGLPNPASRISHLIDDALPLAPPVTLPLREAGLWNLPASYFYPPSEGPRKLVPVLARETKVKLGLRKAAKQRRVFHLWFHPFNLASEPAALLSGLEDIFVEVNRLREAGELDNLTMGELADALNKRAGQSAEKLIPEPV